jgi:hypothetical protein
MPPDLDLMLWQAALAYVQQGYTQPLTALRAATDLLAAWADIVRSGTTTPPGSTPQQEPTTR